MLFGLPEHKVRVVAPDVGGGFGPKDHDVLSRRDSDTLCRSTRLERPIKWIEDRRGAFYLRPTRNVSQISRGRDTLLMTDGRILLAVRDCFLHDAGAYTARMASLSPMITATARCLDHYKAAPTMRSRVYGACIPIKCRSAPIAARGDPRAVFRDGAYCWIGSAAVNSGLDRAGGSQAQLHRSQTSFPGMSA